MEEKVLVFYVQGSAKEPYRVAFWKEENSKDVHSGCGCPAGRKMMYCKHRFQLIEGDLTNLDTEKSENYQENLTELYNWLQDSDIGDFFTEFTMAKTGEKIKKMFNKYKFGYTEKFFNLELLDYEYIEYSNEELKEKYNFDYYEIDLKEFLDKIESNVIVIGDNNKNYLFDINSNYFGTYVGDRKNFKSYGLKKIDGRKYNYTKSEYLISCYELCINSNMSYYNYKMKEIMK